MCRFYVRLIIRQFLLLALLDRALSWVYVACSVSALTQTCCLVQLGLLVQAACCLSKLLRTARLLSVELFLDQPMSAFLYL